MTRTGLKDDGMRPPEAPPTVGKLMGLAQHHTGSRRMKESPLSKNSASMFAATLPSAPKPTTQRPHSHRRTRTQNLSQSTAQHGMHGDSIASHLPALPPRELAYLKMLPPTPVKLQHTICAANQEVAIGDLVAAVDISQATTIANSAVEAALAAIGKADDALQACLKEKDIEKAAHGEYPAIEELDVSHWEFKTGPVVSPQHRPTRDATLLYIDRSYRTRTGVRVPKEKQLFRYDAQVELDYRVIKRHENSFEVEIQIHNVSRTPLVNWHLQFRLVPSVQIYDPGNFRYTRDWEDPNPKGGVISIASIYEDYEWVPIVYPDQTAKLRFKAACAGDSLAPTICPAQFKMDNLPCRAVFSCAEITPPVVDRGPRPHTVPENVAHQIVDELRRSEILQKCAPIGLENHQPQARMQFVRLTELIRSQLASCFHCFSAMDLSGGNKASSSLGKAVGAMKPRIRASYDRLAGDQAVVYGQWCVADKQLVKAWGLVWQAFSFYNSYNLHAPLFPGSPEYSYAEEQVDIVRYLEMARVAVQSFPTYVERALENCARLQWEGNFTELVADADAVIRAFAPMGDFAAFSPAMAAEAPSIVAELRECARACEGMLATARDMRDTAVRHLRANALAATTAIVAAYEARAVAAGCHAKVAAVVALKAMRETRWRAASVTAATAARTAIEAGASAFWAQFYAQNANERVIAGYAAAAARTAMYAWYLVHTKTNKAYAMLGSRTAAIVARNASEHAQAFSAKAHAITASIAAHLAYETASTKAAAAAAATAARSSSEGQGSAHYAVAIANAQIKSLIATKNAIYAAHHAAVVSAAAHAKLAAYVATMAGWYTAHKAAARAATCAAASTANVAMWTALLAEWRCTAVVASASAVFAAASAERSVIRCHCRIASRIASLASHMAMTKAAAAAAASGAINAAYGAACAVIAENEARHYAIQAAIDSAELSATAAMIGLQAAAFAKKTALYAIETIVPNAWRTQGQELKAKLKEAQDFDITIPEGTELSMSRGGIMEHFYNDVAGFTAAEFSDPEWRKTRAAFLRQEAKQRAAKIQTEWKRLDALSKLEIKFGLKVQIKRELWTTKSIIDRQNHTQISTIRQDIWVRYDKQLESFKSEAAERKTKIQSKYEHTKMTITLWQRQLSQDPRSRRSKMAAWEKALEQNQIALKTGLEEVSLILKTKQSEAYHNMTHQLESAMQKLLDERVKLTQRAEGLAKLRDMYVENEAKAKFEDTKKQVAQLQARERAAIAWGDERARRLETMSFDAHGNPAGSHFDLARDGAMEPFKVCIANFVDEPNLCEPAVEALRKKGFQVFLYDRTTLTAFIKRLDSSHVAVVISDEGAPVLKLKDGGLTSRVRRPAEADVTSPWTVEEVGGRRRIREAGGDAAMAAVARACKGFHERGGGLFLCADHAPRVVHANAMLRAVLGNGTHAKLAGNNWGEQQMRAKGKGGDGGFNTTHVLGTGMVSLDEGRTLSTMKHPLPLKPFAVMNGSQPPFDYKPAGSVYVLDREGLSNHHRAKGRGVVPSTLGRVVVDGGDSRMMRKYWSTAGTERFIVNAVTWLVGIEDTPPLLLDALLVDMEAARLETVEEERLLEEAKQSTLRECRALLMEAGMWTKFEMPWRELHEQTLELEEEQRQRWEQTPKRPGHRARREQVGQHMTVLSQQRERMEQEKQLLLGERKKRVQMMKMERMEKVQDMMDKDKVKAEEEGEKKGQEDGEKEEMSEKKEEEDPRKELESKLVLAVNQREQHLRAAMAHLREDIRQTEKQDLRLRNRRGSLQMILDQLDRRDEQEMIEQKARLITLNKQQRQEEDSRQQEDRRLEKDIAKEKERLERDRIALVNKKKKNIDAALAKKRVVEEKRSKKIQKTKKNLNRLA